MTKSENILAAAREPFVILASSFIRHLSFFICHS
jgi:hypothetical protein